MEIRLQKYLSQCGIASRRKSEELIEEGRVKVNGRKVTEMGTKIDPSKDRVQVGKRIIYPEKNGIVLLNKPRGVVSTMSDPAQRRTIADFLGKDEKSYFPVGRLDYESSGLMILTNDGALSQRLAHPKYEFIRIYEVKVRGEVTDKIVRRIERGVKLRDGMARAKIRIIKSDDNSSLLRVSIGIGKNRIIRRLMEHVRHPVLKLKRISHGPFNLGKLKIGEARRLDDSEYERLKKMVLGGDSSKRP